MKFLRDPSGKWRHPLEHYYYARECLSEWMLARWGYERMKDNRLWRWLQF